jgi:hypothetical protein
MKSKLLALAVLLAIPGVASANLNGHGEATIPALSGVQSHLQVAAKAKARDEFTQDQKACLRRAANPQECTSQDSAKPAASQPVPPKTQR